MSLHHLTPPCLLFLLIFCALPVGAAPPQPSNLRHDILYTTRGEFVQVSPMRPLTLNAHVQQFAYEPLGVEVAFVGSEVQGDQTVHFVKTMDVRTGHEMNRLTLSAPSDADTADFLLLGWSLSGKYLLLQRFAPDPQNPAASVKEYLRWDVGANPPVLRPITPAAHLPESAQPVGEYSITSPRGQWILFKQRFQTPDAAGEPGLSQTAYLLYDPDRDAYRRLTLPPGTNAYLWSDDTHLRLRGGESAQQFDVVTGKVSPLAAASDQNAPAASKKYPDLTLDVEHRLLEDVKGSGGRLESRILWVRRTPAGRQPLGTAAAGLTPGSDDPQAVWSPTGKQIAFLSHGDLYVTDLATTAEPGPQEKMAVGLPLTCEEERRLAENNLKQIGLGLIQYAQDNDEHYPSAEGVNEAIYPYLKTRDVFQVGGHAFVYQLPGGMSLAKIDSPAETVQGTIDLPCARVVLFADGHVKSFPKQATTP
jgi:hypothetical protein